MPAGNLREAFSGYKRTQSILITKTPEGVSIPQEEKCIGKFDQPWKDQAVFSTLEYQQLVPLLISGEKRSCSTISEKTAVFLLTGIANPKPLLLHLKQYSRDIRHHDYPDHYRFKEKDILELISAFESEPSEEKIIITTEKDAQRLLGDTLKELLLNLPIFYLPIQIGIRAKDKTTFDQKILDYVSSHTRNR
ncbi:tetraacyldisaccharide 4'-kinase [compost metagenome]